jgi:hypothetical protein
MEVFQTVDHYILLDGDYSLWCSRSNGTLEAKRGNAEVGYFEVEIDDDK